MTFNPKRAVCHGADTKPARCGNEHFEYCRECGKGVRWDLVAHWWFGFQTCEHAPKKQEATEAKAGVKRGER